MDDRHHPIVRLIDIYARHARLTVGTVSLYASGSGATYRRLRDGADITVRRAARIIQWLSDHWPASAVWPSDIPRPAPSPDGEANPSASPACGTASPRSGETARSDGHPPAGGAGSSPPVPPPATGCAGVPARGGPSSASAGPAGGGEPNPSTGGVGPVPPVPPPACHGAGVPARGGSPSAPPPASLKRDCEAVRSGSVATLSGGGAAPPTRRAVRDRVAALCRARADAIGAREWDRAESIEREAQALAVTLAPDGRIASPAALVEVLGVSRSAYDYVVRQYAGGHHAGAAVHPDGPADKLLRALRAAGDVRFTVRPAA